MPDVPRPSRRTRAAGAPRPPPGRARAARHDRADQACRRRQGDRRGGLRQRLDDLRRRRLRRRLQPRRRGGIWPRCRRSTELPADAAVARSVIPPGTAATRDFASLSPQLPAFDFEACVGCMTCVNACPDTAILAVALPGERARGKVGRRGPRRRRTAHATSRTRRSTPRCRPARATSRRRSGSSWTLPTARAAASASRSATRWGTTR